MNYKNKLNHEKPVKEIYVIENYFEGNTNIKQIFKEILEQKLKYINSTTMCYNQSVNTMD